MKIDPKIVSRWVREGVAEEPALSPDRLLAVVLPLLTRDGAPLDQEKLVAVALGARGGVIAAEVLTVGSHRFTVVDPPQVLRWALTRHRPVTSLAIAHNHPGGDPNPSSEDHSVTRALRGGCIAIRMTFADHLIVGDGGRYYSFAEHGH